jgi:hypothetical protein
MTPDKTPPNYSTKMLDLNDGDWALPQQYDFVHARLTFSIPLDFPAVMRKAYGALRPGGWVEFKEYLITLHVEDPEPPAWEEEGFVNAYEGTKTQEFWEGFGNGLEKIGMDWREKARHFAGYMEQAGFQDVKVEKLPVPMGGWAKDPQLREFGGWYGEHIKQLQPLWDAAMGKGLGWSQEKIDGIVNGSRQEQFDKGTVRLWHEYWIIYGRKPEL